MLLNLALLGEVEGFLVLHVYNGLSSAILFQQQQACKLASRVWLCALLAAFFSCGFCLLPVLLAPPGWYLCFAPVSFVCASLCPPKMGLGVLGGGGGTQGPWIIATAQIFSSFCQQLLSPPTYKVKKRKSHRVCVVFLRGERGEKSRTFSTMRVKTEFSHGGPWPKTST